MRLPSVIVGAKTPDFLLRKHLGKCLDLGVDQDCDFTHVGFQQVPRISTRDVTLAELDVSRADERHRDREHEESKPRHASRRLTGQALSCRAAAGPRRSRRVPLPPSVPRPMWLAGPPVSCGALLGRGPPDTLLVGGRMFERQDGGCQCGGVRYRVTGAPLALAVCHCKECQRQSGSAFGMSLVVSRDSFELLDGALRDFTRSSDSGRPVRCFFCPECGTRIYHEPAYAKGVLNVKAGTLDDTSWLAPELQAWTSSRQSWIDLPAGLKSFERQPQ